MHLPRSRKSVNRFFCFGFRRHEIGRERLTKCVNQFFLSGVLISPRYRHRVQWAMPVHINKFIVWSVSPSKSRWQWHTRSWVHLYTLNYIDSVWGLLAGSCSCSGWFRWMVFILPAIIIKHLPWNTWPLHHPFETHGIPFRERHGTHLFQFDLITEFKCCFCVWLANGIDNDRSRWDGDEICFHIGSSHQFDQPFMHFKLISRHLRSNGVQSAGCHINRHGMASRYRHRHYRCVLNRRGRNA